MIKLIKHHYNRFFVSRNERTRTVKKNIIWGSVIRVTGILVNILYVPILIDYLDAERYGVWIALTSFLAWFNLFDVGLGNGLRNKLAEALAVEDITRARKYVSTSYALMTLIFIPISTIFFAISGFLPWSKILNVHFISHSELSMLGSIVFIFFCIRFIVQLIQPILFAVQKSAFASSFPVLGQLMGLICIYFLRSTSLPPLLSAGMILSLLPVLAYLAGGVILFRYGYSHIRPAIGFVDFSVSRDILSLGIKFFIVQIGGVIINASSSFIIIQLMGPTEVTQYNISFRYFKLALLLNTILMTPLWSSFTDALAKKDFAWAKRAIKKLNMWSFYQALLVLVMLIASPLAYRVWVGDLVMIPYQISAAMAIFFIINVFLSPYSQFINGSGKLQLSVYLIWAGCVIFIVTAILLGRTSLGVTGVVIASILTRAISLVLSYHQTRLILENRTSGIFGK